MKSPTPTSSSSRVYRGATAEDRRQQRHERLLEAAFESFARHGITRTTMRDICAVARLTDRYFYESFRNTEDAFEAVYQWQKGQLMARLTGAMQDAPRSLMELARAGLRAFYEFMKEDPRRAQVLLIDAFSANQQTLAKSRAAMGQYATLVNQLAQELYPNMRQQDFNIEMMTWGLLGMTLQVGINWAQGGYKQPIEEVLAYNLYAWQGLEAWIGRMISDAKEKDMRRRATDPKPGEFGVPPGLTND
jgi:AcrR family transcriptional regulator